MIIRKSQLLIRTIIVRKQGPRGTRQKKLQKYGLQRNYTDSSGLDSCM